MPFFLHLLEALLPCKIKLFILRTTTVAGLGVPIFRVFTVHKVLWHPNMIFLQRNMKYRSSLISFDTVPILVFDQVLNQSHLMWRNKRKSVFFPSEFCHTGSYTCFQTLLSIQIQSVFDDTKVCVFSIQAYFGDSLEVTLTMYLFS